MEILGYGTMSLKFHFTNILTTWLICLVITFGLLALGVCTDHPIALSYGVSFLLGLICPLTLVEVIKDEKK